jgi:hypothetical protein
MEFSLGDIVSTTKGPAAVGIVRAVYEAGFYSWAKKKQVPSHGRIDDNYYTVEFPEPIRVITVQEIREEFGWKYQEALEYLETLEKHKFLDYPQTDIEMFS